jgi:hypothetical protein
MPELDPGHSGVRDGGAAGRPPNQNATAQFRRRSGTSWRMSFRRGTGGASAATVAEQQVAERRLQRRSGGDPQLLASDKRRQDRQRDLVDEVLGEQRAKQGGAALAHDDLRGVSGTAAPYVQRHRAKFLKGGVCVDQHTLRPLRSPITGRCDGVNRRRRGFRLNQGRTAPVRHPLSLSDKRMAAWRRCAGSRSAPGLAEQPVLRDGSQGDHAQRRPTSAGPGAGRTDAVRHAGGQAGEVRQAEGRDSVAAEVGSEQRLELRVAVGLDRAPIRGEVVRW